MSVETVRAVVKRFPLSSVPEVIAIKGPWGVGKTYMWNAVLQECAQGCALAKYSYVSLFGVRSSAELRTAILLKAVSTQTIGQPLTAKSINENWRSLTVVGAKRLYLALANALREVSYAKHVYFGVETMASYLVDDTIICIDDFERSSTELRAEDVLGLILELKEERRCKVALILNDEELKDDRKDRYQQYREKVIDMELSFSPNVGETIDWAISKDFPFRAVIEECATKLGMDNIRALRKTGSLIRSMLDAAGELHPMAAESIVRSTCLLCASHFTGRKDGHGLDSISKWNGILWSSAKAGHGELSSQDQQWRQKLLAYGTQQIDEIDLAIADVVKNGYVEGSDFLPQARKLNERWRQEDVAAPFSDAWQSFHFSLEEKPDELVEELFTSAKHAAPTVSPLNLSATVNLLRDLGASAKADELIDYYVSVRRDEPSVFNLSANPFATDIRDPHLLTKFEEEFEKSRRLPSLGEAATHIAQGNGWNPEHIEALERGSVDDYYHLFKQPHGRLLPGLIKACLRFENDRDHAAVAKKAAEALSKIAGEGPLNAMRLSRFGIKP